MTAHTVTAHAAAGHYRPPGGAFTRLLGLQVRMAWREPWLPLLGLVLPFFFLVAFSSVPSFTKPYPPDPRFTVSSYLMPMWIALALCFITLFALPQPFVRDRENRWLRRISTPPVPPSWLLGAHTLVSAVLALVAVAVLTLGSVTLFGMATPGQLAGYALAALLFIAAMFALGLVVTAVAPTAGIAAGLGNALLFPLMFFGGIWVQRPDMAPALQTLSDYTPLMAGSQALREAMVGVFPSTSHLLVLVGWAVVCSLAAVRFFRWE